MATTPTVPGPGAVAEARLAERLTVGNTSATANAGHAKRRHHSDARGRGGIRHELVATEVAASLRYAQASLTRDARSAPCEDDDLN